MKNIELKRCLMSRSGFLTLLLIGCLCFYPGSRAHAVDGINIRLSYKVFVNPASGSPAESARSIQRKIDRMNVLQAQYKRGFRFVLAEPVQFLGSKGDTTLGRWYSVDFLNDSVLVRDHRSTPTAQQARYALEVEAQRNKKLYRWNTRAINIYVNAGTLGGKCALPSQHLFDGADHLIGIGDTAAAAVHLHEIGHYFGLLHTHETGWGSSEDIRDTIEDRSEWRSRDKVARENYGAGFDSLSDDKKNRVLNVWNNVMSYHPTRTRLTEGQLDKWSVVANNSRNRVIDGRVILVGKYNGFGGAANPYPYGADAFRMALRDVRASASKGKTVMVIRPGAYKASSSKISFPVVLRATRLGPAVLR